jgi:hypothetical protein
MSGGKYIQVPLELEDRLDDWILCNGVVEMSGREVVSVERVVDGRLPKVHVKFSDNSKEEFDIIVTSEKPDFIAKWHLDEVTLSDVFKSQFGLGGRVTSTNIIIHVGEGEDPRRLKAIEKSILNGPAMFWGRVGDGRVIGALIRDGLWDSGSSKLNEKFGITVYHSSDVLLGASDFVEYLEVAFPWMSKWLGGSRVEVLDSIVEEIVFRGVHENKMLGGVTSDHLINTKTLGGVTFQENFLDSLYSFNNKFRLPKFGSQLQVIGPYYYCRSSIGDILNDSKWLADRICERYEEFPKFIENEDNSDWISRGGSISLDGSLGTAKSTRI